ncbi:DUF389 domain-containing protein [Croceiramulus getboli]|nr:DUF389 domain-containing protein [Flavobacteriaceae bacterium YJPT1-3]
MQDVSSTDPSYDDEGGLLSKDAKGLWEQLRHFLSELFSIKKDSDRDSTIESVRKDIPFRGHNAWILIFSILVASLGLNISSTAVVIGAMLISPLMGPIVGVGLSVAINDIDTLKRSLVNLSVMIGLSVLTAFLYFSISPLTALTPELEARTYPTILDVLVAIFGGLALIVAKTKKGTIASVIFGVAIATALMPPLCTVGYGLAVGEWAYALGAMYLFSINAVFIALSTFVVSKLLGFPLVKYANSKKRRRIARLATLIAVIVMIPSCILFYDLLQESYFLRDANQFVENELDDFEGAYLQRNATVLDFGGGKDSRIEVSFLGKTIPPEIEQSWRTRMKDYNKLENTSLIVLQNENTESYDELQYMRELKRRDSLDLMSKEDKIAFLEQRMKSLERLEQGTIPFAQLSEEVKIIYKGITRFSFAPVISTDFKKSDTIPTFTTRWADSLSTREANQKQKELYDWLKFKLKLDTLELRKG